MARIIVLQACRHGVGCSHLVANLAVLLMQRGYRVGLLDTDLRGGGIRTIFSLDDTPEGNLNTYWWLSSNADTATTLSRSLRQYSVASESTTAGIYLPPVGGQFTTAGPQLKTWQEHYHQGQVREVLQHLSQDLKLDYLLIDNQPEMSEDTLMALSLADMAVLMLQLDSYDFQRVPVLLEVIKQFETPKTWLVPTLVLPAIERDSVKHKIENTYQQPIAGLLYLSEEMIRLASSGLFCLHYPIHPLTQTMMEIARQLEHGAQELASVPARFSEKSSMGRSRQRPLLNLLEFPHVERRLLTVVLRQGPIEIGPLIEQSGHSADEVITAVNHLIQQGWIVRDPTTQRVRYRTETSNRQ